MAGSAAGPGRMHTSASAHAKLPGSNEHMSLRLKAVGQQVFKICNRKGRLSGGERGRGRRGPGAGGRETDRERERGGNQKKKKEKKAFAALGNKRGRKRPFCCCWHRMGRKVRAKSGEVCPSRLEFARSRAEGARMRTRGRWRARRDTQTHTHIYMCAHVYIYMHVREGGGRLSLGERVVGEGREPHAALLAGGGSPEHSVVGRKNKGSFQASTWPEGNLAEDSPTRGSRPAAGPCNALTGSAAGHRCPLPPRGGGTPMGTGILTRPPAHSA